MPKKQVKNKVVDILKGVTQEIIDKYEKYWNQARKDANIPKEEYNDYYCLIKILREQAHYSMIFGERSNGKTFAVLEFMVWYYHNYGKRGAVLRRYDLDLQGKRGSSVFNNLVRNKKRGNIIKYITGGKWTGVYYYSQQWFLYREDENGKRVRDDLPFCYGFTLSAQEHDKSSGFPDIDIILFDEFLTRSLYLTDEFVLFANTLSTIIRDNDTAKIFMCGNTVNKYSPYFKEMGVNISDMKIGDIRIFKFATLSRKDKKEIELKIAVEYSDGKSEKPSDVYFAFNNPKMKMITNGVWEVAVYPHLPLKYKPMNILYIYFIIWEEEILQCEIIQIEDVSFTYIHRKTTPIKDEDRDLVFSQDFNPRYNYRRKLTKPIDEVGKKIAWFFSVDKVYYQDNEVGEVVRNYLNWCKSDRGFV